MHEELIKQMRSVYQEVDCPDCPLAKDCMTLQSVCAFTQAADAIEELQNKLCDWCGVCPKERRRPSDCEIIYPNMQVPEVAIIPAEVTEDV